MVRAPTKSCPSLSRLFEGAEPELLAAFLSAKPFEKFEWLEKYRLDLSDPSTPSTASDMLRAEKKVNLGPLETEAARIVAIAGGRGQYALEGMARERLDRERLLHLMNNRDELARSLWAYVHEHLLFEAAENSLHLRLYRRYDKHYQTFMAEPSLDGASSNDRSVLDALLEDLRTQLDRGEGYNIDRFDIPEDGDEPAAEMYLVFHPNPPTSVREIDDDGNRTRIYFRPPGEAMIVYTPSTGRVHVRAGTRRLRHVVAQSFIETVLEQPYSSQPVDFQAYDISRFFEGLELSMPSFEEAIILRAQVIRADVSIHNLANRLSLSTSINQDITEIIDSQPGLGKVFERAVAIRFVEIAVRYRRADRDAEETLDFTLTDRNTSSLLSIDDPFERVLGHRLLREWGILREGRAPTDAESMAALPALLAIWDIGADRVGGSWLLERGVDPLVLTELGFLVLAGWEGDDLTDDEDDIGQVAAEVVPRTASVDLKVSEGQVAPGGNPDRFRVYRVRESWVAQHLRTRLGGALDDPAVEELTPHLLYLGTLEIDRRDVPVYLARSLDHEKIRTATDTELRLRNHLGTALVLQAGNAPGNSLGANVLTSLSDHIADSQTEFRLVADKLRSVFRRHRLLARGGQTVRLVRRGESKATLSVPGAGTIDIAGANRITVIERLVNYHDVGLTPVATADLIKGMEGQSLANIFQQPLWNKLKADFIRSPKQGQWQIAI